MSKKYILFLIALLVTLLFLIKFYNSEILTPSPSLLKDSEMSKNTQTQHMNIAQQQEKEIISKIKNREDKVYSLSNHLNIKKFKLNWDKMKIIKFWNDGTVLYKNEEENLNIIILSNGNVLINPGLAEERGHI